MIHCCVVVGYHSICWKAHADTAERGENLEREQLEMFDK